MDHPTRERLYEAILAEPGVRIGTLAARSRLSHNTVKHHVRRLERDGLVVGLGLGQRRWFARGQVGAREARARAAALSSPAARALYDYLRARGSADLRTASAHLGLAPSTLSVAAARMREAGIAQSSRAGRRLLLRLAADSPLPRASFRESCAKPQEPRGPTEPHG